MIISVSLAFSCLGAYFIGGTMSAIWIAQLFKLPDPRSYGSKNPGATNMVRGKSLSAAALTFFIDILKGFLVCKAMIYADFTTLAACIAGICATLGHMFPFFHGYQGGKGAATFFGTVLAIAPTLAFISIAVWGFGIAILRNTGLSTVMTALVNPVLFYQNTDVHNLWPLMSIMSFVIILRHQANLQSFIKVSLTEDR